MANTVAIPGRRINEGEEFFTDWIPRGGDCIILRVEILVYGGGEVSFALETRGEDGTTVTTVTPTSDALDSLTSEGVATCLYLATTSTTAGNGCQEKVRVVVSSAGTKGDAKFMVVRIFPLIFFDSARAY